MTARRHNGGAGYGQKRFDGWLIVSVLLLVLFIAVLIYPMFGVIKQAVIMPDGSFSWEQFHKFFSNSYYVDTIYNSFKITILSRCSRS